MNLTIAIPSNKDDKDQKTIQSSTTLDPGLVLDILKTD